MYLIPNWFFGIDVIFEFVFAVITLILGIYSLKIYKLTSQKQSRLFGISFLLFSISYFIQSLFNFFIITRLGQNICEVMKIQSVTQLHISGLYFHMLFYLLGLITLTYTTLKIKSQKAHLLLILVSLLSFFVAINKFYLFYVLSSLLLAFIIHFYTNNCSIHKNKNAHLVLVAFICLFLAKVVFIFSLNNAIYYVAAHILELAAYVLILVNLMLVLKK